MNNYIIEKIDVIDSTNDQLERELNLSILNGDKLLIAREQFNGHGTNGRSFISRKNVGIYFSLLHFYKDKNELKYITQKAAVAVYNAFYEMYGIELSIKWVNDLIYNDKKVAGILCRNLIKFNAVIIGIGIDLFKNNYIDDEIKDIAGYIFNDREECIDPYDIVYKIVDNIYDLIKIDVLPKIYIDKNIIKDEKIYEDCNLEC